MAVTDDTTGDNLAAREVSGSRPRYARTSADEPVDPGLARDLSRFARRLQHASDPAGVLQRIVETARSEIDGASAAGVMLIQRGKVATEAGTDPLVNRVDQAQYSCGDGPCLTSLREEVTVRSDDLRDEPRWPRFAAAAVELGVLSMLSVQLFAGPDNLGALNLFADTASGFTPADEQIALLLASHAAIALANARKIENLNLALQARDVIGQAKGIIMERFKLSDDHAFQVLVAVSQHSHRKLRDVAADLATTGEIPTIGPGHPER